MTGEFSHKGPVTRKMLPFDDIIMWWFTLIPFASWFLLPALPLNYALSCSENRFVPQERIKTIFSQNKPIFKQKLSLKMVSTKYRPFVGTGATYTISLEICTRIGCALFCCGHNIIDSWHTFYWLGLQKLKSNFSLVSVIDGWGIQWMSLELLITSKHWFRLWLVPSGKSHYMSRYRPSSMPPNGVTRPQCVN